MTHQGLVRSEEVINTIIYHSKGKNRFTEYIWTISYSVYFPSEVILVLGDRSRLWGWISAWCWVITMTSLFTHGAYSTHNAAPPRLMLRSPQKPIANILNALLGWVFVFFPRFIRALMGAGLISMETVTFICHEEPLVLLLTSWRPTNVGTSDASSTSGKFFRWSRNI